MSSFSAWVFFCEIVSAMPYLDITMWLLEEKANNK